MRGLKVCFYMYEAVKITTPKLYLLPFIISGPLTDPIPLSAEVLEHLNPLIFHLSSMEN